MRRLPRRLLASTLALTLPLVLGVAAGACGDDPPVTPAVAARCIPPARATDASITLAPALGDQAFALPIEVVSGPARRFYVLEQKGLVRVVAPDGGPPTTALDLTSELTSGGEAGLLGIAFDQRFADNGFVYLHFTAKLTTSPGVAFQSVVARFRSNDGGLTFDPASQKRMLVVDQPFANHNGGKIAVGPDGLLYIGLGDGGSGGDPRGNGQNKDTLLGAILRIDPNGEPYAIPPSNPFASGGGRPEIYAYGLRNPWKFSFDTLDGELWVGDVGQGKYEEVDRVVAGGNYGWSTREGMHCYAAASCSSEGLIDPVAEYPHSEGVSITGGYVYRGAAIPSLYGKYVYGDFGSGRIWAVEKKTDGTFPSQLLAETNLKISTFAEDSAGELYVVDYATGTVKQLVAAPEQDIAPSGFGAKLTETGCLDPTAASRPPAGMIGYAVNSPLWSDGATKDRWLYVPAGEKVGVRADGDLDIPPGAVAVKTFTVAGKKIETRLFAHYADQAWAGFSYEWNDEQTEATLLAVGKTKPLASGGTWTFPSRAECFACHTPAAGFTLGLEARQLDRDADGKNQLERFNPVLERPLVPGALAPLRAADSAGATEEERARGYLHANCSGCHREGSGAGAATLDLRIERSLGETGTCNAAPQGGDLGIAGARLVAPGDPARSTLAARMRSLDPMTRMPQLGTRVVDEVGVAAVEAWIRALPSCP